MACGFERRAQRPNQQAPDPAGIAKPNLRLGRVDVDIEIGWRDLEKQRQQRRAGLGNEIAVCRLDRADQEPVFDRPAIDEQILLAGVRAMQRRQAGETIDPHWSRRTAPLPVDLERVGHELAAHDAAEPVEKALGRRRAGWKM